MFLLHIPLFQSTVVCNSLCTYRLVFFLPFISSLKWAAFTLCGESSNAAERGRDTAVRIVTTRQEDGGKCSRQNAKVKRKSLLSVLTHALYVKLNVCACVCVCAWMDGRHFRQLQRVLLPKSSQWVTKNCFNHYGLNSLGTSGGYVHCLSLPDNRSCLSAAFASRNRGRAFQFRIVS